MAAGVLRSLRVADEAIVFVLANDIAAIEAGRRALLDFLDADALGARIVNRIEVVFEEVVSNIIRHGFEPGAARSIRVTASSAPGVVTVRFEDDGIAFDPLAAEPKPRAASLTEAVLGGLGVPLIRKLAASVAYRDRSGEPVGESSVFRPTNDLSVTIARD